MAGGRGPCRVIHHLSLMFLTHHSQTKVWRVTYMCCFSCFLLLHSLFFFFTFTFKNVSVWPAQLLPYCSAAVINAPMKAKPKYCTVLVVTWPLNSVLHNSLFLPSPCFKPTHFILFGLSQPCTSTFPGREGLSVLSILHPGGSLWSLLHAKPLDWHILPHPFFLSKLLLKYLLLSKGYANSAKHSTPSQYSQYFVSFGTFVPKVINSTTIGCLSPLFFFNPVPGTWCFWNV